MRNPPSEIQLQERAAAVTKTHGIGLTGGIATGKSTIASMLKARGYTVIDADLLAREVVAPGSPGLAAIASAFGQGVLDAQGQLDRARMRTLVFGDAAARRRLEAITHPLIQQALAKKMQTLGLLDQPRVFFYEAALLFEIGAQGRFRAVWATHCAPSTQIQRLCARDRLDREAAANILASQMPAEDKARLADYALATDDELAAINARLDVALAKLGA